MGIVDRLLSLLPMSDRSEVQFHRIHNMTPDGERQRITYITGEVVKQATIVECSAELVVPEDSVLVKHDDQKTVVDIGGRVYSIYDYTPHKPDDVPLGTETAPIPDALAGKRVGPIAFRPDDLDALREVLP